MEKKQASTVDLPMDLPGWLSATFDNGLIYLRPKPKNAEVLDFHWGYLWFGRLCSYRVESTLRPHFT